MRRNVILALLFVLLPILPATGAFAAERWQRLSLPEQAGVPVALGRLRFPDGQDGVWLATDQGSFRRLDTQWQPWPESVDPLVLRAAAVAPDADGRTAWWLLTEDALWRLRPPAAAERLPVAGLSGALHSLWVEQSQGEAPAVLWLGSDSGLLRLPVGELRAEPVSFAGVPPGAILDIRVLRVGEQRQLWLAGPGGLARRIGEDWQRWGRDCLRGRRVLAVESFSRGAAMQLLVATSDGALVLDPQQDRHCEDLSIVNGPQFAALRDARGRVLLVSDSAVVRMLPRERGEQEGWTRFDARDGLEGLALPAAAVLDPEAGVILAGAGGLWRLADVEPPDPMTVAEPSLRGGPAGLKLDPLTVSRLPMGRQTLVLDWKDGARDHARQWRLDALDGLRWLPAQASIEIEVQPGRQVIQLGLLDEYGRVRPGPRYLIDGKAGSPGAALWLIAGLLLATSLLVLLRALWRLQR